MSNEGKKVAETVEGLRKLLAAFKDAAKDDPRGESKDDLGTYALLEDAIALLSDPASQVGREKAECVAANRTTIRVEVLRALFEAAAPRFPLDEPYNTYLRETIAALAISPPVKCETCKDTKRIDLDTMGDDCPDCSQPKAAQAGDELETLIEFVNRYCPESSGRDLYVRKAQAELQRLRQSRDAGRWIPWDVDADAITPESGWHLTTVRGCRGDDLRITGVADFAKDNVIAYWSIPLPPPFTSRDASNGSAQNQESVT